MSKTFIDKACAVVPEIGMLSIVSMTRSSRWKDICFDRRKVFICQSKGMKDRYVPISSQMLLAL